MPGRTIDPYRYDLQTGSNAPVSVRWFDGAPALAVAQLVRLSPDGRLAAFSAAQTDELVNAVVNPSTEHVYVRDMARGSNFLISRGTPYPNNHSVLGGLSPDGRWLLFASWASNLAGQTNATPPGFYVADLGTNAAAPVYLVNVPLRWVGSNALTYGNVARRVSTLAAFSADSRWVLVGSINGVLRRTDLSDTNAWAEWTGGGAGIGACALSSDGELAAYWSTNLGSVPPQIWLRNLRLGTTEAVPMALPNRADAVQGLAFSSDGSYLVFAARSPGATQQVFVYDRLQHALLVVSTNQAGAPGNSVSSDPVLGADGRTVVFQSFARDRSAVVSNTHG